MNNVLGSMTDVKVIRKLKDLKLEMTTELERLLKFWSTEALDAENGGFIGRIDHFGNKDVLAPKGVVLNTRILWSFSSAYRATGLAQYKKMADMAFDYLINYFWDKEEGGFVWAIDYNASRVNTRKQTYAQGFGIYALSEYNRATGNRESLEYARQLFYILENKFKDLVNGGYIESLAKDWMPLEDMRLSKKDANAPKSMNTHLHILEPFANLYRVWPDRQLKKSIHNLISLFQNKIIDPKTGHFNLFFEMDWSVLSTAVSFGHDIEGAWLMHEAALVVGDASIISQVQQTAIKLVDITLAEGLDKDGSLFNERDGDHYDTDKHWWPQAEAMVGLMDAYEINQDPQYLEYLEKVWVFIKSNLIDQAKGEWYWSVDKEGNPHTSEDKVGFWKCPYHNSRALIELVERIEKLLN